MHVPLFFLRLTRHVCPNCGSIHFRRSARRTAVETALSAVALPHRCQDCDCRFFRFRLQPNLAVPGRHTILRYGAAFVAVLAALAVRLMMAPLLGHLAPYSTFYLATIATAYIAGRRPAILAALLGWAAAEYFFVPSQGEAAHPPLGHAMWLLLYLAISACIIAATYVRGRRTNG